MSRRGVALLVVMWLGMLMGLLAYAFLTQVRYAEAETVFFATDEAVRQGAMSGLERAVADLPENVHAPVERGDWWNSTVYEEIEVGDTVVWLINSVEPATEQRLGGIIGRTLGMTRRINAGSSLTFGFTDENSRLNVNTATHEMLMTLPNMTDEIAASIVTWRGDEDPSGDGATDDDYQSLNPPYHLKGEPFETVQELLLVRGVTPELLFGEDANFNGILDVAEDDADRNPPSDNRDGTLDRGWFPFLTAVSYDLNVDVEGNPRVNIEQADAEAFGELGFGRREIRDIMMIREMRGGEFESPLALLDAPSVDLDEVAPIYDRLTVHEDPIVPGMININTAPREVLMALPGMEEEVADRILEKRGETELDRSTIFWLLQAEIEMGNLRMWAPFITTRSVQYRIDAVAVHRDRPVVHRFMAIWDRNPDYEGWVYLQDITRRGMPLSWTPEEAP